MTTKYTNVVSVSYGTEADYVKYDVVCTVCGKNEGYRTSLRAMPKPTHYCNDCRRAIKVAQMQRDRMLPELD